jgi:hypothetical protein
MDSRIRALKKINKRITRTEKAFPDTPRHDRDLVGVRVSFHQAVPTEFEVYVAQFAVSHVVYDDGPSSGELVGVVL